MLEYLSNLYRENIPEFDSEMIIKVMKSMTYFFLYATLLSDIFVRVVIFSAITLFSINMLEDSLSISYQEILIAFLGIESIILFIKLLLVISSYSFMHFKLENIKYFGTKFPLFSLIDINQNSLVIELINIMTIELLIFLSLIGFFLKYMLSLKSVYVYTTILLNILLFVLLEIINPVQSLFFNKNI